MRLWLTSYMGVPSHDGIIVAYQQVGFQRLAYLRPSRRNRALPIRAAHRPAERLGRRGRQRQS